MKSHKTIMIAMIGLAVLLIIFGPVWGVGRGLGLLLLICPLMMFGMMAMMMGHDKDGHK